MASQKSCYCGKKIEFHILQSFPVTCLNRDDVGSPKTAVVGGVLRARVSSQCWKRQVRLALRELGATLGTRTKKLEELFKNAFLKIATSEQKERAIKLAKTVADSLSKDTLLFISDSEVKCIADLCSKSNFEFNQSNSLNDTDDGENSNQQDTNDDKNVAKGKKKEAKDLKDFQKKLEGCLKIPKCEALDIALFGRMVAKVADMNIEAACSFAHAISTHKVSNDIDFFTALDDYQTDPGASHIDTSEFNSATYYRYIGLDIGQLTETLGLDATNLESAVRYFTKALFTAVPSARQHTHTGASAWDFARIYIRQGQNLQASFEKPIKTENGGGYLIPSINCLKDYLNMKEKMCGSIFGKIAQYEFGENPNYSIDNLIDDLVYQIKQMKQD